MVTLIKEDIQKDMQERYLISGIGKKAFGGIASTTVPGLLIAYYPEAKTGVERLFQTAFAPWFLICSIPHCNLEWQSVTF